MIGYSADEVLEGRPSWMDIVHPEDAPRIIESIREIAADAARSTDLSYRINRKDGEVRRVDVLLYPVCDLAGRPVAVGGALFDVTRLHAFSAGTR